MGFLDALGSVGNFLSDLGGSFMDLIDPILSTAADLGNWVTTSLGMGPLFGEAASATEAASGGMSSMYGESLLDQALNQSIADSLEFSSGISAVDSLGSVDSGLFFQGLEDLSSGVSSDAAFSATKELLSQPNLANIEVDNAFMDSVKSASSVPTKTSSVWESFGDWAKTPEGMTTILGGLGGAAKAGLGYITASETAKQNKKIAEENRESQERMLQEKLKADEERLKQKYDLEKDYYRETKQIGKEDIVPIYRPDENVSEKYRK